MKSDFEERGRVYFPDIDFVNFSESDKNILKTTFIVNLCLLIKELKNCPKIQDWVFTVPINII